MSWFSNLFGGSDSGDDKGLEWIQKPAYTGEYPWKPSDIGWGTEAITPLAKQYLSQIMERSRGEGLVGFDPKWYETRKKQGLGDLSEQYREGKDIRSAQSSGQGLRGGIPVSIEQKAQEDYGDTTADFLDKLTIADLEARREDINKATYAQPSLAQQASNMQTTRANFDLNEYGATMPLLYEYGQEESNPLGNILGTIGSLFGSNNGTQQTLAQALASLNSSANSSITPQKTMADYRAETRRY